MHRTFPFLILLFYCFLSDAQIYKDPNAPVESRVESMLSSMTLDEKLSYIGGVDGMYIMGIPRLNLPEIKMSDGPVGVRTWGETTAYPAGICNAATWDKNLVFNLGQALGKDARARGVHILLAPGVNIYRAPMCGRNFEYFGEDPFLAGLMALKYVEGVQSEKVVATVKHFAGNNQEWNRYDISSDIDERTLQEIYLPAFRSAVIDAKAGAVMNAYNLLNGVHCTQNNHLNNEILKGQWKFKGILMSDWGATHDGVAAANGGLDLEMPSGSYLNPSTLSVAISEGLVSEDRIESKVRRILRIIFSYGFYDNIQTDSSIPLDNPDNDSISLQLARNGIVLLKNDHVLPFNLSTLKSLAVIGPNADQYVAGGGSSYTSPFHYISVLKGITDLAGSKVTINYVGLPQIPTLAKNSVFYSAPGSALKGLSGYYFNNQTLADPFAIARIDTVIDFHWSGLPNLSGIPADHFSIRWTGVIRPSTSGKYNFYVRGDDGFRLWVNNQLIIDNWVDEAATVKTAGINLTKGQEYPVKLEYYEDAGLAEISLGYESVEEIDSASIAAATNSEAAVICAGFNSSTEGEGFDRPFNLDADQDSLISQVARVNPNTVVILNSGGNVDMHVWLNNIKGLVHAWYPGQNGGKAIAEILFGRTNPSGKLPVTFEKQWSDNPVYGSYYPNNGTQSVKYNEGLFVGYRYYDKNNIKPQFPFGFGLSYTTFEYSNLILTTDSAGNNIANFDIKNTGNLAGSEAAQLYISPEAPKVSRPVKELKGFVKVNLQPAEKKTVTIKLDASAFSYYSVDKNSFVVDKGEYDVIIGASSEDEKLRQILSIDKDSLIFLGVKNISIENDGFDLYPNPASDHIILQANFDVGKVIIMQVYDLSGRLVDHISFIEKNFQYNCSHLSTGLYLCRLIADSRIITKKFLVEQQ
jgi:beta-glucosidase